MRDNLSSLVELIGAACILTAAFAADWRVGVALIGVLLVAVGYLADQSEEEQP